MVCPEVLNIAGNRESVSPGIGERTERFLCELFRQLGFTLHFPGDNAVMTADGHRVGGIRAYGRLVSTPPCPPVRRMHRNSRTSPAFRC